MRRIERMLSPSMGIVKLTCVEPNVDQKRNEQSRCRDRDLPVVGSFGSEDPKRRSRDKMALVIEGIVDDGMHAEETLGGSSRFEPSHLALSSSHHLM